VIVLASVRGKEFVATAGTRRTRPDQRFRIGSVTKTFTATLVLQLVDEGKLRLDDTLDDHVRGAVPRGDEITVRQLLLHRSGLVDYTDDQPWFAEASRSSSTRPIDILRRAGSKPLAFEPGSRGRYSNTDYIALGLIVEAVTGNSYGHQLDRRIVRPLGLAHTTMPTTRRLPDIEGEDVQTPSWPWPGDWLNPVMTWATGGIVSNAYDLAHFYAALLSGQLLKAATLTAMKRMVGETGLGLVETRLPCGRVWSHAGWLTEWMTFATASENGDRVAVVSVRGGAYPPSTSRVLECSRPPPAVSSSSGGSRIAFVSTSGARFGAGLLQVADANTGTGGWLTFSAVAGSVAWSADGRRIAFVSDRDGNSEVYVTSLDGRDQQNTTRHPAPDFNPVWSPDGRRIAFVSPRVGFRPGQPGNYDVYVMDAGGRAQRRLTRGPGNDRVAGWSPDGSRLLLVSQTKRGAQRDVYVMNADGSRRRKITSSEANDDSPVWSPDGRRIAFVRDFDVYVTGADGRGERRLTQGAARDGAPDWSPDGRKLVFERQARSGDKLDVFVVNVDGSGLHRLTSGGRQPRWSPDGRLIAFSSSRDGNLEIYVMRADGSSARNLTRSPGEESSFAWSPLRTR
jgi:Tol biopolymer transport system component